MHTVAGEWFSLYDTDMKLMEIMDSLMKSNVQY